MPRRITLRRAEFSYTRLMESWMSDTEWRAAPATPGSNPVGCTAAPTAGMLPGDTGTDAARTAEDSTSVHAADKPSVMGQCSGREGERCCPRSAATKTVSLETAVRMPAKSPVWDAVTECDVPPCPVS